MIGKGVERRVEISLLHALAKKGVRRASNAIYSIKSIITINVVHSI